MQEEIEHKTVNFAISTVKMSVNHDAFVILFGDKG